MATNERRWEIRSDIIGNVDVVTDPQGSLSEVRVEPTTIDSEQLKIVLEDDAPRALIDRRLHAPVP